MELCMDVLVIIGSLVKVGKEKMEGGFMKEKLKDAVIKASEISD